MRLNTLSGFVSWYSPLLFSSSKRSSAPVILVRAAAGGGRRGGDGGAGPWAPGSADTGSDVTGFSELEDGEVDSGAAAPAGAAVDSFPLEVAAAADGGGGTGTGARGMAALRVDVPADLSSNLAGPDTPPNDDPVPARSAAPGGWSDDEGAASAGGAPEPSASPPTSGASPACDTAAVASASGAEVRVWWAPSVQWIHQAAGRGGQLVKMCGAAAASWAQAALAAASLLMSR